MTSKNKPKKASLKSGGPSKEKKSGVARRRDRRENRVCAGCFFAPPCLYCCGSRANEINSTLLSAPAGRGDFPLMSSALQILNFHFHFFPFHFFQIKTKTFFFPLRPSSATRQTSPKRTAPSLPSRAPPSPRSLASRSSRRRPRAGKAWRRPTLPWRGRWSRGWPRGEEGGPRGAAGTTQATVVVCG